ncbi:MAG: hypothetical protein WCG84_04515 [Candidatus Moraniibacteriota bacterium]
METETKAVKKVSVKVKVKKKTAKKTVVKKPRVPQAKKEYTVPVLDPEQYFWLADGGGLASPEALAEALEQMTEAQFAYHTERDGNDFARWIEGVFGDKKLARLIVKQKTAQQSAAALRNYLAK